MKIKYKLFSWYFKLKFIKFSLTKNWLWDYGSYIELLILKLTSIGLYFAKFGIVIDKDRKQQVRSIWQARKYLLNFQNAFEITEEQGQKKFYEKYKVKYESKIDFIDSDTKGFKKLVSNTLCGNSKEQKEEMETYWTHECWNGVIEQNYETEMLNKYSNLFTEKVRYWWD